MQTELITSKGYVCEDYSVVTEDGFILSLQRIPHGKRLSQAAKGVAQKIVFLQHGLLDSSTTWVLNLPEQSLGMLFKLLFI